MAKAKIYRLAQIVERFGGKIVGDAQTRVSQIGTLESADAQQISFLAHSKYRGQLAQTRAGAVIVAPADRHLTQLPRIVCDDPYLYFAKVSGLFNPPEKSSPGVHRSAMVGRGTRVPASASIAACAHIGRAVKLGKAVIIGPGCYLGDGVELGDASRLDAHVTIYAGCRIGQRALVHAGAVIGADGFGLAQEEGRWRKIPQIGSVRIGDDVEIGANTCIDRGALDDTIVEDGVKLDNLIQIGHNVHIGAHTAIAGCTGIAGSTRIGRHCMIGGSAMIIGHLEIADRVIIHAAAFVTKSIRKSGAYSGYPAEDGRSWTRHMAALRHVDALRERVRSVEKQLTTREKKA